MTRASRLTQKAMRMLLAVAVVAITVSLFTAVAYADHQSRGDRCRASDDRDCQASRIFWTGPTQAVSSSASVRCEISISDSSGHLAELATNLAPGQACEFSAQITNPGDQPLALFEWSSAVQPTPCKWFVYSDNVASLPEPIAPADQSFHYHGTLSLSPSAGSACEGSVAVFYVVITGSPVARCSG